MRLKDACPKKVDEIIKVSEVDEDGKEVVVDLPSTKEILELAEAHPGSRSKFVYVRKAYTDIYENYIKDYEHILITGNPGTGKTFFLVYVAYKILQDYPEYSIVCGHFSMPSDRVVHLKGNEARSLSFRPLSEESYCYLYDCGSDSKLNLSLAQNATKSIIFSSPDKENYKSYYKQCIQNSASTGQGSIVVYMPTWSWDELKFCQKHIHKHINDDELNGRFALWGGIARAVFQIQAMVEYGRADLLKLLHSTYAPIYVTTPTNIWAWPRVIPIAPELCGHC